MFNLKKGIYRDSDNSNWWRIRYWYGRFQRSKVIAGGIKDVRKLLAEFRTDADSSTERGANTTLGTHLGLYLEHCESVNKVRPTTLKSFKYYLTPLKLILKIRLDKLTVRQ